MNYLIIKSNVKKDSKEKTIFDTAYENIKFSENKKLKKLYCSKNNTTSESQVNDMEYSIYYYDDKNELQTYIYHNYIKLTDEYMDFYDKMYNNYKESLEKDYNYDNVKTDIISNKNEILVTIVTNKSTEEKSLGLPNYVNYEAAKQEKISEGFNCE